MQKHQGLYKFTREWGYKGLRFFLLFYLFTLLPLKASFYLFTFYPFTFKSLFLPFYFFTFLPLKAFLLFNEFPVSQSEVMDELSSSLGPYKIGMCISSAHLLQSAIALRVEEGTVAGTALG